MESILKDQYSELDREVLLKNQESLNLFLEYGNKWGLFAKVANTERHYSNEGALDSLGYYINHLLSSGGPEKARSTLTQMDMATTSPEGDRDFAKLKRAIIDAQRGDFTTALEKAQKTGDEASIRGFKYELDNLKISEYDLKSGQKRDLFTFDPIGPRLLPTWLLIIKANKLQPNELQQILGVPSTQELPADPVVNSQLNTSHQQTLKTIKPE